MNRVSRLSFILVTVSLMLVASGCMSSAMNNMMRSRGQVLKEYKDGKDTYMVIKEGQRIIKYRIFKWSAGMMAHGMQSEVVYSVDPAAQACFTGQMGQTSIDCEKIKKDPDIGEYIKW